VFARDSVLVFGSGDWDYDYLEVSQFLPGRYLASCVIPGDLLNWGSYTLTVMGSIAGERHVFSEENVLTWEICKIGGAGDAISSARQGICRPRLKWIVLDLQSKPNEQKEEI